LEIIILRYGRIFWMKWMEWFCHFSEFQKVLRLLTSLWVLASVYNFIWLIVWLSEFLFSVNVVVQRITSWKESKVFFFWINQEVNVNLLVCSTCFNKIFIKAFINKPTYSRCWLCICTLIFVIMFEEQLQHKVIV